MAALADDVDYRERTIRNEGLLRADEQRILRETRFVVAGCGSTGGAVLTPLVRSGARRFVLFDPGTYELNNLNRQDAFRADLGRNKGEVQAERLTAIDPSADIEVHPEGVAPETIEGFLREGDVVIDAVDVTTQAGCDAKRALHEAACRRRVLVLTAYDIATTQYLELFDYRRLRVPFGGRLKGATSSDALLRALVPPLALPRRIFPVLILRRRDPSRSFPQLVMTSTLLGALVVPLLLRAIGGHRVRARMRVDVEELVLPVRLALVERLRAIAGLPALWWRLR